LASITIIVAYWGTVSFPFEKSGSKQIMVKVIDNRGMESFLNNQIMNAGEY